MKGSKYSEWVKGKGNEIPLQAWTDPEGSRRLRLPQFKTIGTWRWYGCQPYVPTTLTPQEIFLVLISIKGWVKPRDIVRAEGLCQWKFPMIPSGMEPATFRLTAQCLNQLRHRLFPQWLSEWSVGIQCHLLAPNFWKRITFWKAYSLRPFSLLAQNYM